MYPALTAIVVAVAVFSFAVVRQRRRTAGMVSAFVYVGAAVLGLDALVTVVTGLLTADDGRAESVAMFGLFTYAIYLLVALGVDRVLARGWRGPAGSHTARGQLFRYRRMATPAATAPAVAPAAPAPNRPSRTARRPVR
jgi:hypothetical protein